MRKGIYDQLNCLTGYPSFRTRLLAGTILFLRGKSSTYQSTPYYRVWIMGPVVAVKREGSDIPAISFKSPRQTWIYLRKEMGFEVMVRKPKSR